MNRGIGLALTQIALEKGHEVIGVTRDVAAAEKALGQKNSKLNLFAADVTVAQQLKTLGESLKKFDGIDVLINNAGVSFDSKLDFDHLTADEFVSTFQVNVIGVHLMTQAVKPLLLKSKTPRILNISSIMGSITENASGKYYAYRSSKAALNMWNKSFSLDHPQIMSVVIHPGWVATDMGGPQATTQPADSAAGIMNLVESLQLKDTGQFFDFQGKKLSW